MKIESFPSHNTMSKKAAELIRSAISEKSGSLVCAASGYSTLKTYQLLTAGYLTDAEDTGDLKVLKLDEWGGLPMDHPGSCEAFLQENLIMPLKIPDINYISFQSMPEDKEEECERVALYLKNNGPIDVCVLGLGANGHIAFNEPGTFLNAGCHIAELSTSSLSHDMVSRMEQKPAYGLTLGMGDILQSKLVLLLITGQNKCKAASELLSRKVTTSLPASFLWLHPNAVCLINNRDIKI